MTRPPLPRSACFSGHEPDLVNLAHAVVDWLYTDTGIPRNRQEANLCNWANWILDGEHYATFDLEKFPDGELL